MASGSGSNALAILEYFHCREDILVVLVASNNSKASVLSHAREKHVPAYLFTPNELGYKQLSEYFKFLNIDLVVLAGYMKLLPFELIELYKNRIINIHPSLFPHFKGKGMYGMNVHMAVKDANVSETGITIHLVNEEYDAGRVLFQAKTEVLQSDTPEAIAQKVLHLEHQHYSEVIESYLNELHHT